jgi:hypothetical protein
MRLGAERRRLQTAIADPPAAGDPSLFDRVLETYGQVQTRFEAPGGYELEDRVEGILLGLGFTIATFSIGSRPKSSVLKIARSRNTLGIVAITLTKGIVGCSCGTSSIRTSKMELSART